MQLRRLHFISLFLLCLLSVNSVFGQKVEEDETLGVVFCDEFKVLNENIKPFAQKKRELERYLQKLEMRTFDADYEVIKDSIGKTDEKGM